MKKLWLFSMIWIAITSFIFGWVRHVNAQGDNDAQRLLEAVSPYMASEGRMTFKYTGYYGDCTSGGEEQQLQVGKKLSQAFDLPQSAALGESNGHPVYSSKSEVAEEAQSILTVAAPANQPACYVVLRLESAKLTDPASLLVWQEQASGKLKELNIKGQWNVMIQGHVDQQMIQGDPQQLAARLARTFKATEVERYEDPNTLSVSMATNQLQASIKSGSKTINLQAALHQESTTGSWRLTVGTPVITMEY